MKTKKLAALLLTGVMLGSMASNFTVSAAEADLSKHLDLTMYLVGSESPDHDKVMEKVNAILEEKLNCSLTLNYIGFGEYDTKYPLLMSSGETIDLIYASDWVDRPGMVDNGAFLDVSDIVQEYAPNVYEKCKLEGYSEFYNGAIYVIPANHVAASPYGYIIRGDVREELGFDEITTFDQYIDFCIAANTQTEYKDSMCQSMHEYDRMQVYMNGYEHVYNNQYWMKYGDPEHKVYFIGDIPEVQEFNKKAQELANAGAWSMSVLSNTDANMMEEGLSAAWIHGLDMYSPMAVKHPEYNLEYSILIPDDSLFGNPYPGDFMAVPASAQDPARSLMVLDLIYTDQELFNLLTYGIEGEHFEINEDGQLVTLNADGYAMENGTWGFRSDDLMYDIAGTPETVVEVREHFIDNMIIGSLWKFSPNVDSIKNEVAACDNAYNQYYVPVSLGYVEYESGMEDLNKAMEAAGKDIVIAELQAQIDAYFAE